MWHIQRQDNAHRAFLQDLMQGDNLEDLGMDGR